MLSSKFCEISKNAFFYRTLLDDYLNQFMLQILGRILYGQRKGTIDFKINLRTRNNVNKM